MEHVNFRPFYARSPSYPTPNLFFLAQLLLADLHHLDLHPYYPLFDLDTFSYLFDVGAVDWINRHVTNRRREELQPCLDRQRVRTKK